MKSVSHAFDPEHPLRKDRVRLEGILDIMYAKIQKTLFPGSALQHRRATASQLDTARWIERTLTGTGASADDVLSEALIALLSYPPARLDGTWEGLGVAIAENKAVDALRAAEKGLRGTDHRPPLQLVSGDRERKGPDGEREPALFESLTGNDDPEAEYYALQDVLKLRDLAREVLDSRDQEVFFAIHFKGERRKEVGERLGLTGQRIGQVYNAVLRRLEAHPDYPFDSHQS